MYSKSDDHRRPLTGTAQAPHQPVNYNPKLEQRDPQLLREEGEEEACTLGGGRGWLSNQGIVPLLAGGIPVGNNDAME